VYWQTVYWHGWDDVLWCLAFQGLSFDTASVVLKYKLQAALKHTAS
jgi:hypothetical protein